jgi:hypothetical protein
VGVGVGHFCHVMVGRQIGPGQLYMLMLFGLTGCMDYLRNVFHIFFSFYIKFRSMIPCTYNEKLLLTFIAIHYNI